MITITTSGSSIIFEFDDNQHYLQNGTIEVPVNSLLLVTDSSNMATFKKAATNDIFLSALYSELGMTKEELIAFYEENMVGSTGGGGGIDSGTVQTMIDESISGKADTSAVTDSINAAVSGKVDTSAITSSVTSASTDSELPTAKAVYDALGGGGSITIDPTLDSGSTNAVANSAITNAINAKLRSVDFMETNWAGTGTTGLRKTTNGSSYTNYAFVASINQKPILSSDYQYVNKFSLVETSAITTSITSASTDAQVPSAKAVYDQLDGLKLEQLTQSEYDDLVSGGTVDSSTIYFIVNNS